MSPCPNSSTLQSLIDDDLTDSVLRKLDRHLLGCVDCRQRLDELTSTEGVLPAPCETSCLAEDSRNDGRSIEQVVLQLKQQRPCSQVTDPTHVVNDSELSNDDRVGLEKRLQLSSLVLHYRILQELGSGGSGQLFLAHDTQLDRQVALKVLHPSLVKKESARERLHREAKVMAGLNHVNVVTLYDIVTVDELPPFLVLEFVDGQTLEDEISSSGPMAPKAAAKMVTAIASGLHAAHQAGVVHRDVKSSNILLGQSRVPRITDFGLARTLDSDSRLTMEGMIAGTPAYMSPEQIDNARDATAISDTYSLGIVLYELLTGTLPFRGTPRMTLAQVVHDDPQPPRSLNDRIPVDLETICLKAISKEPFSRYDSALAFQQDLERFLDNRPVQARRTNWILKSIKWCQRNPTVAGLWGAVAATFVLATAISVTSAVRLGIANDRVRQSESIAQENRIAAGRQRDASLRTVRRLLVDVPKALRQPDGETEVEKLISQIALEGLSEVASSALPSENLDRHSAMGNFQLGATYWRAGELKTAKLHLQTALSVLRGLDSQARQNGEREVLLANTYLHLGYVESELGHRGSDRENVSHALTICDSALTLEPGNFEAILCKAICLDWLAEDDELKGLTENALRLCHQAGDLLQGLTQAHSDSHDLIWNLQVHETTRDYLESAAKLRRMSVSELQEQRDTLLIAADEAEASQDSDTVFEYLSDARNLEIELSDRNEDLSNDGQYAELTIRLADLARYLGYADEAVMYYSEATSYFPTQDSETSRSRERRRRVGSTVTQCQAGEDAFGELHTLAMELENLKSPELRDRMDLVDVLIQQLYDPDLTEPQQQSIAQRYEAILLKIDQDHQAASHPHWKRWRETVRTEID